MMYVVSVTPRNVPLRNITARQLSNVLQWNLPIVDMLEVVIILYIYIHCSERGSLHGGFSYLMYTPIVLPTCTYTMYMYMCVLALKQLTSAYNVHVHVQCVI